MEVDDAEADDVIATVVGATTADRDVTIMSGDRDYYQLVTDRVTVLNTAVHPGKRHIGPGHILDRYGVTPARWAGYRALTGDTSDAIPGVRGVGPATAAVLLAGGLSLEDVPASGRLVGARGRAVTAVWDDVLAWRDLIRLRTTVPVSHTPSGRPSPALPRSADVIERLGLW